MGDGPSEPHASRATAVRNTHSIPAPVPAPALASPPGGLLLWIIVALELGTFAMVLGAIAYLRGADSAAFRAGQALLDPRVGAALTAALVTSGWLAAEGVHAYRAGQLTRTRRYFGGAVLAGAAFAALKVYEYVGKARTGLGLGAGDFWDLYFLGTGFHFVHVLIGLGLLSAVGLRAGRTSFDDPETAVAGTALFWHMCDLVWFFLFPLFFVRM